MLLPYRDLSASAVQIDRLRAENAELRAHLGRSPRNWLGVYVTAVLVITAAAVGSVSWWLVTA